MFPLLPPVRLLVRVTRETPWQRKVELRERETWPTILPRTPASRTFRDLLHAVNLRHGTHGFTSLSKEGVLRIFPLLKIRRLRPGLNPRTWVPKASTLPLDHRSRYPRAIMRPEGLSRWKFPVTPSGNRTHLNQLRHCLRVSLCV